MDVFVTGGRGEIGAPTVAALLRAGHHVTTLARSDDAARDLAGKGTTPVRGDLREPDAWIGAAVNADAIVHAAAGFEDDDEAVETLFIDALITAMRHRSHTLRVIYTGGCWLYGETGDNVADEAHPFAAPDGFIWAVSQGARLHAAEMIDTITMHPAMVYGDGGGVFDRWLDEAQTAGRLTLWGDGAIRWPVVHRDDVGEAYRLAVERGAPGQHYNIAAEAGLATGRIADAVARRFDLRMDHLVMPRAKALAKHGLWAEGPMINQQMSGAFAIRTLGWRPRWTDACAFVERDMKLNK